MSQQLLIVELLGDDNGIPAVFTQTTLPVEAVYTSKKKVFCFKEGRAFPITDLTEEQQKEISLAVLRGKYKFNAAYQ